MNYNDKLIFQHKGMEMKLLNGNLYPNRKLTFSEFREIEKLNLEIKKVSRVLDELKNSAGCYVYLKLYNQYGADIVLHEHATFSLNDDYVLLAVKQAFELKLSELKKNLMKYFENEDGLKVLNKETSKSDT